VRRLFVAGVFGIRLISRAITVETLLLLTVATTAAEGEASNLTLKDSLEDEIGESTYAPWICSLHPKV